MKVITGIFSESSGVEQAVNTLKSYGMDTDNIKIVSKTREENVNNLPNNSVYDRNLGLTNQLLFGLTNQDAGIFGLQTLARTIGGMPGSRSLVDVSGLFSNVGQIDGAEEDYKERVNNGETLVSVYTNQKEYGYIEDVLKQNGAINTGVH